MATTLNKAEYAFLLGQCLDALAYIENLGAENPDKDMTEEMFDAASKTLAWANTRMEAGLSEAAIANS